MHRCGVHRPLGAARTKALSPFGKIFRFVRSAPLESSSCGSFCADWRKTATAAQTSSLGNFSRTSIGSKPANRLHRNSHDVRQAFGPCYSLIRTATELQWRSVGIYRRRLTTLRDRSLLRIPCSRPWSALLAVTNAAGPKDQTIAASSGRSSPRSVSKG